MRRGTKRCETRATTTASSSSDYMKTKEKMSEFDDDNNGGRNEQWSRSLLLLVVGFWLEAMWLPHRHNDRASEKRGKRAAEVDLLDGRDGGGEWEGADVA